MPYNRNIYNTNMLTLAQWIVPVKWRGKVTMAWVKSMAANWMDLFDRFLAFRKRVKYKLLITPQVCYLEKALNDKYDFTQRRIFIEDGDENDPLYLYMRAELKPVKLYKRIEALPAWLIQRTETAQFGVDFTIHVPADITFDSAEMRTFVNVYKLVTKTYQIVTF